MFIHVSPTLSPITALKALLGNSLQPPKGIRYFSCARGALITAIESLKQHHNLSGVVTVWLPAFICDMVVILLKNYSINYKYYHVTNNLEPDFNALEKQRFNKNDFFLLVHYFGFPMEQDKTADFCGRKGLILIEDCAHSIVKEISKSKIGTRGEAGIFGLRKILPLPNGGILYLKDAPFCSPRVLYTTQPIYRQITKMIAQWFFQKIIGHSWKLKHEIINKDIYSAFPDNYYNFDYSEPIDKWAEKIIAVTNISKVIDLRRRNFQILMETLSSLPSITIPETLNLNEREAVPWIFFFYHNDAERLINFLIKNGVSAAFFPTLPADVRDHSDWKAENLMYKKSVSLPIHQDVNQKQLKRIASLIKIHG